MFFFLIFFHYLLVLILFSIFKKLYKTIKRTFGNTKVKLKLCDNFFVFWKSKGPKAQTTQESAWARNSPRHLEQATDSTESEVVQTS